MVGGGSLFPDGGPLAISEKVNADVVRALSTPEGKARLGEVGVEAITSTPEQFGQFMASEAARWGKLVREANLRVD